MVVEIKGSDGKRSKTLGVPVKLSETPGAVRTPPVDFGTSTPDILRELGYSENEIERFEKEGVT
jgi:crotonobetainyl-CoA:carnitine CoA-transferase CaiB-like acyl-CoA transferase